MPEEHCHSETSEHLVSWVKGRKWVLREALKKTQAESRAPAVRYLLMPQLWLFSQTQQMKSKEWYWRGNHGDTEPYSVMTWTIQTLFFFFLMGSGCIKEIQGFHMIFKATLIPITWNLHNVLYIVLKWFLIFEKKLMENGPCDELVTCPSPYDSWERVQQTPRDPGTQE